MMRILLIEDEKYIALAVAKVLKKNNYAVDLAHDGEYGLDCALTGVYDVIAIDIMLPKLDGFSVLQKVRENNIKVPVILLTAKSGNEDKIRGLDLGADDYLAKPFHTEELLARLRALLRRNPEIEQNGVFTFANIELNTGTLTVRSGEHEADLQLKEAQILELLIIHRGSIVPKETIIEKIWGYDTDTEYNHVEKRVSLLRKKLAQVSANVIIRTVRGSGYRVELEGEASVK
jgi:DNA-binding response OmpR family regulator